ncbi:MAG TPA: nucleotidyl transferase AbiEii/AbiGii toxin family protein [Candidatus Thermoplasmatota archaeon]|jgi:hypothetical protein|nr:nucleotidyl transferase AbiEii/AbiGii toxin family protein [Candidatus Thermoplasmatota archaeon]
MELPPSALGVLRRVVESLEAAGFETMLVGGLATFAWGEPRTTRDLDVAVRLAGRGATDVARALNRVGAEPQGPFSTDFGPRFILPFKDGLPVDVFLADEFQADEFARRRRVTTGDATFWVLSPEDLVASKLRSAERFPDERAKDLADAAGVLFKQWANLDHALVRALAERTGLSARFDALAAEVREARRRAGLPA